MEEVMVRQTMKWMPLTVGLVVIAFGAVVATSDDADAASTAPCATALEEISTDCIKWNLQNGTHICFNYCKIPYICCFGDSTCSGN